MRRAFLKLSLFLLSMFFAPLLWALAVTPTAPQVNAKSYLLMDYHSGKLLAAINENDRMEPASLTKLMALYVINRELNEGKLKLTDKVLISEKAWKTQGSKMFVNVGESIALEDLLKGVMIQSGNDASVALAEHVAGSEDAFANLMNHYAQKLGMKNSHFTNATGLPDPELYTTAFDMALLARALIQETTPKIFSWYSEKWFAFQNIRQQNRNRLLWRDIGVDGLKTGHTESAGFCLVATALRDGMRLISVVMGADNDTTRADESQKLLTYGFRFFETHKLFASNASLNKTRVWMGKQEETQVGITQDIYVTIPQGKYNDLDAVIAINAPVKAPLQKGQNIGKVTVKLGGELVAEQPLVSLDTIEQGGFFNRISDYISLRFHQWGEKDS